MLRAVAPGMIHIIWEFRVRPGKEAEFENHYSDQGTWAKFFRQDPGYHGTQLVRDAADPHRYVTIDAWDDESAYGAFRVTYREQYNAIDKQMEALTESEKRIGVFQVVASGK